MRAYPLQLLLTLLFSLLSLLRLTHAHAATDEFETDPTNSRPFLPKSITLYQWPLDAAAPTPLGQIGYDPRTKTGKYFSLLKDGDGGSGLVRVGVQLEGGRGWVGGVVDAAALDRKRFNPLVTLRLDAEGRVWNVEFAGEVDKSQPPKVIVLPRGADEGPKPALNKPIVVGPDGKVPQPEVEKTFLQKYWWIILAGMILLLSGGGGQE